MMNGFIVLHRKLLDWEWHDDPYMMNLWVSLLLMANHEDRKWHGKVIKRGQLVTDRESLSVQTGLSVQQLRTRLDRLVECECINRQTTNKYTLITICNYSNYQDVPEENNQQITNDQPTNNQQITRNNNNNKDNNISLECDNNTREEENFQEEKSCSNDVFCKELSEGEENKIWRESFCMNLKLTPERLRRELRDFNELVKLRMESHTDVADYARHFTNYIYTNFNSKTNEKTTTRLQDHVRASSPTLEIGKNFKPTFDF